MKNTIIRKTMQDVIESVANANAHYSKRETESYDVVAKAIDSMNKTVIAYNNTVAHDAFDSVATVEQFASIARTTKVAVKLDSKNNSYKLDNVKTIMSIASLQAWKHLDNVEILPKNWQDTVKIAFAELAAMVARLSADIETDAEIARINAKYGTDVRGSKRDAKHHLQELVSAIMPGYIVSGADLTKVMLGTFKVNVNTWKIILPTEDTFARVLAGMLAAMVNKQDVTEIFEYLIAAK